MKVHFGGCHSNYWWIWLHISSITTGLYHISCILYFNSATFRMDGSCSSWMTLPKVLPHRYKQLLPSAQSSKGTVSILYTCIQWDINILLLLKYNRSQCFMFSMHGALASGWMRHRELGWHIWSCRQTDVNFSKKHRKNNWNKARRGREHYTDIGNTYQHL